MLLDTRAKDLLNNNGEFNEDSDNEMDNKFPPNDVEYIMVRADYNDLKENML